jgi:hypothetical protein
VNEEAAERASAGSLGRALEVIQLGPGPAIAALARRHAGRGVSPRALEVESLLHLPRLADSTGLVRRAPADAEVARLSRRLHTFYQPVEEVLCPPAVTPELSDLRFGVVEEPVAAIVAKHLHYLHSPRRQSLHFGSYTSERRLVAMVSLSRLDIPPIAAALPDRVNPEETVVLSRVFAFDWAPRNTISHLLANVERRLREAQQEIRLLLTYLNPNLGFDGASYRAANWSLYGYEAGTRYGYLDDDYITDREIARLPAADRRRVVYSLMPLAPLMLFGRLLRRRDRRRLFAVHIFQRP